MSMAPAMATGRAEARRALDEGAEAEADEQELDAAVVRDAGDGVLDHFEITRLHGDVVDEDGAQDDPADGQQPVGRAVGRGRQERELRRHPVDEDRDGERRGKAQDGGPVRLYVSEPQEPQQDDDRDRRHEGRKKHVPKNRRVYLSPSEHFYLHEWAKFIGIYHQCQ